MVRRNQPCVRGRSTPARLHREQRRGQAEESGSERADHRGAASGIDRICTACTITAPPVTTANPTSTVIVSRIFLFASPARTRRTCRVDRKRTHERHCREPDTDQVSVQPARSLE